MKILILDSSGGFPSKYGVHIISNIIEAHKNHVFGIGVCESPAINKKTTFAKSFRMIKRKCGYILVNKIYKFIRKITKSNCSWVYNEPSEAFNYRETFSVPIFHIPPVNSAETVEFVKENEIDIVFHSGGRILRKPILDAPSIAVVGYHHGDITKYRGPFQGFWELYYNERFAGVTIQTLKSELDTGEILILVEFEIKKNMRLKDVQSMLNWESVSLGAIGIERLINNSNEIQTQYSLGTYRSFPNFFQIFLLFLKGKI